MLFVDFSSAYNTLKRHIMVNKLKDMNVHCDIIALILDFVTYRKQYVNVNGTKSSCLTTNTGAPQGRVLSPILFTLYTSDCTINHSDQRLIKFADDSSIIGLITEDEEAYRKSIDTFVTWCDEHYLLLNVKKTKELIFDFRRMKDPLQPICIKNEEVEVVSTYKYLGVTIDDQLSWIDHTNQVRCKVNKRLYFLRLLNNFHVEERLMALFYKSTIESMVLFPSQAGVEMQGRGTLT